jgi:Pectinacetylesterase
MGWQFRGQANVEALLRTIAAEPLSVVLTSRIHFANHTHEDITETYTTQPLAAGSRLLFAGCSAGARGAMFTADFIAPMLPAGVTVHAFFDSPMWIDVPPLPGVNVTSLEAETQAVFGLVNASARLDPACVATYPGNNSWKCLYGQYRIPFVKTPYLLSMSQFDAFQLPYNEGGKPPYIGAAGAYADEFQVAMRDVALQLPTSQQAGSAVFSSACFKHCVCTIGAFWGVKVNGKSLSHYLGAWYLGTNMEWPRWAPQTLPPVAAPGSSLLPAGISPQWIEACNGFGTGLNGCGECHSRAPKRAPPLPPAYAGWQSVQAAETGPGWQAMLAKGARSKRRVHITTGRFFMTVAAVLGTCVVAALLLQPRNEVRGLSSPRVAGPSAGTPLLAREWAVKTAKRRGDAFEKL